MAKKRPWPCIGFLLIQSFLPVCTLLGYWTEREFVLHSEGLYLILLSAVTIFLTICLRRGSSGKAALLALPLTIINALVMLLTLPIYSVFAAVIMVVCGWMAFVTAPKGLLKTLCCVLFVLLTLCLVLILPIWLFASAMGHRETVMELDSPDGRYTAIVVDVDQGALGGDTLVSVQDNTKTVNILIGKFVSSRGVYHGEWGVWQDMELVWEDEETLAINGAALSVSSTDLAAISNIADTLGAEIANGQVLEASDSHGGFLGDGKTIVKLRCSLEITGDTFWHPLPLTQNLTTALYGGDLHGAFFLDENGAPRLPEVENGFYFFLDRHSKSTNPADDSQLFMRNSYNFTLAVYDADTHVLYYFELDT